MKIYYEPDSDNKEKNSNEEEQHVLQGHDIKVETKNQHEKMKDKPFSEKAAYYFGYYKFHALGVIIGIIAIISIIHAIATNKDYCFVALVVNSSNVDAEALSDGFSEYASLDTNAYDCYIDANEAESVGATSTSDVAVSTRFAAMISTQDLDVTIYDSIIFNRKAENGVYANLREVLSPEDIERFEDKFYYVDEADIEALENSDSTVIIDSSTTRGTLEEQWADVKKHMDPSTMKKPIPVGIVIDDSPLVTTLDAYFEMVPVYGIITNSQRTDTAISFLHYIYEDSVDFTKMQLMEF